MPHSPVTASRDGARHPVPVDTVTGARFQTLSRFTLTPAALLLAAVLACDGGPRARFTKGIEGVWVIDADASLRAIDRVPEGLVRPFNSLDEYRAWVRPKIEGARFEIHPAGKAFMRRKDGALTEMTWEKRGDKYWVGRRGFLSFSIGHFFELKSDREAVCRFQVDYSETVAPRSPLVVRKTWE